MSINAKLNRLSLDLHKVSQQQSQLPASKSKPSSKTQPVADSWEDEDLSDSDIKSPISEFSEPLEAPGPDIKSPTTRAIAAEKEFAGEMLDDMGPPPPTPISPSQGSNLKQDWSSAMALGGGRPTYTSISAYSNSNPSSSVRSTPTGTGNVTPANRYPTPNPPVDITSRDRDSDRDRKRPEKTTATANRLIAGALGIKAPPKTEEQRKYERAVKEQEIKRRNKEKEDRKKAEDDEEKAKAAVWGS